MHQMEHILVVVVFCGFSRHAARHQGLSIGFVDAGLVQCHRVERCKHAHIGDDGNVVATVAVALRRHVHHQTDVEVRLAVQHGLGIFGNLLVHHRLGLVPFGHDGSCGAVGNAVAAAQAVLFVHHGLAVDHMDTVVGAVLHAVAAAHTQTAADMWCAAAVHLHLALFRAAAHADVLQRAAETGIDVSLEMGQ